jgi:hypothetical protein
VTTSENVPVPGLDIDALGARMRKSLGLPLEDAATRATPAARGADQLRTERRVSAQNLAESYGQPDLVDLVYALLMSDLDEATQFTQIARLFEGQTPVQQAAQQGQQDASGQQPERRGEDPNDPDTWSDETFARWRSQQAFARWEHPSLPSNFIPGKSRISNRGLFG